MQKMSNHFHRHVVLVSSLSQANMYRLVPESLSMYACCVCMRSAHWNQMLIELGRSWLCIQKSNHSCNKISRTKLHCIDSLHIAAHFGSFYISFKRVLSLYSVFVGVRLGEVKLHSSHLPAASLHFNIVVVVRTWRSSHTDSSSLLTHFWCTICVE